MVVGCFLIGGFIVLVLLLLAKDEYYDRQEQKKRMELRAEITWAVVIQTEQGASEGKTVNISASGALLWCPTQFSLNEIITLIIKPPVRPSLEINAEVVRTNIHCNEDDSSPQETAVRFVIISEKDRQFLSFSVYDHLRDKKLSKDQVKQLEQV
jgi:hypothetical protein